MKILSVAQVNRYIKLLFDKDFVLNSIYVSGEISNFKNHSSGHWYFTLKDSQSSISCVMFKDYAIDVPFAPENGLAVTVFGYISVYEKTGHYQLYAENIEPQGIGSLQLSFEQLKTKLEQEGLFSPSHKKAIPLYPNSVAVITSKTGAAIFDIIKIALQRNKNAQIFIVPVLVQGDNAACDIATAIDFVNEQAIADVIIVGRGGGSIEDLWAFNEEVVARAIFNSSIPIVSAVGHETDFSISDFVADFRAPTPSAAAQLCFYDSDSLVCLLNSYDERLKLAVLATINNSQRYFDMVFNNHIFKRPASFFNNYDLYLSSLINKIDSAFANLLDNKQYALTSVLLKLELLSPIAVLKRGYCLVLNDNGNIVKSINDICGESHLKIKMHDGYFNVFVEGKSD